MRKNFIMDSVIVRDYSFLLLVVLSSVVMGWIIVWQSKVDFPGEVTLTRMLHRELKAAAPSSFSTSTPDRLSGTISTSTDAVVKALSKQVVAFLKKGDYTAISKVVHPVKGVRFSPYVWSVSTVTESPFQAKSIRNFPLDSKAYSWGNYDGTGKPIVLGPIAYIKKFVFPADFTTAPQVTVSASSSASDSILKRIHTVYPDAIIVEYYIPGIDKKFNGMDWVSLRLVFEQYKNSWYLTGVIHDQWTI